MESAYRGLVAAQLATPGNEAAALGTWQAFRAFDAPAGSPMAPAADGAVLWFLELPDGFVAWLSHGGQTLFHRLDAPKATVTAAARRFLKESSNPQSPAEALRADARVLYGWIVEPFRAGLPPAGASLVIEPDGAMGALPLASLLAADGSYLGDRYGVLISAGHFARRETDPPPAANVLVVANPLVAGASAARFPPLADSLREAEAVRAAFAGSVLLEGRGATLEALARELPRAGIVHFAGHGYSSSGYGGLLLAPLDPATADYRLLRASDMRSMDWSRCRLAVLSACAAAEGETHGVHNPESLIRALAKAGAPRIAANLWNADSAAAGELMAQFYGSLKRGDGPAEALRAAQQALRRTPRWQHPYYWSGFQLYGTT
ncbi:MAG TPA: CHAT domain-containing protein, partial [Candidatus Sulfopaludibacter sp.]|nr:CHAT domain-containing protein [Candidatus Sulfopaludibacter sp.]